MQVIIPVYDPIISTTICIDRYYDHYLLHYKGTNWTFLHEHHTDDADTVSKSPISKDEFIWYLYRACEGVLHERIRFEFLNLFYYPVLREEKIDDICK